MFRETGKFVRAFFSSPHYLVLLITSFLFLVTLRYVDLPVWDDASTYDYGYLLLQGDFSTLNVHNTPLVVLLTALFNIVFHDMPIVGYYVFDYVGYVLIAIGSTCLLRSLGYQKRVAAFLGVAWIVLVFMVKDSFPLPTLHLYHQAVPLLIASYILRKRPISLAVLICLLPLAYLERMESLLVLIPLCVYRILRSKRNREGFCASPVGSGLIGEFVLLAVGLIAQYPSNFLGQYRLQFAFMQHFNVYAVENHLFDAKPYPNFFSDQLHVLHACFGEGAEQCSMIQLFLRNPKYFALFVGHNLGVLAKGGYDAENAYGFSVLTLFLYLASCVCIFLLRLCRIFRRR